MSHFEPPIHWSDHEDIVLNLYGRFGNEFNEGKYTVSVLLNY